MLRKLFALFKIILNLHSRVEIKVRFLEWSDRRQGAGNLLQWMKKAGLALQWDTHHENLRSYLGRHFL